jgi:hypothetical protein
LRGFGEESAFASREARARLLVGDVMASISAVSFEV